MYYNDRTKTANSTNNEPRKLFPPNKVTNSTNYYVWKEQLDIETQIKFASDDDWRVVCKEKEFTQELLNFPLEQVEILEENQEITALERLKEIIKLKEKIQKEMNNLDNRKRLLYAHVISRVSKESKAYALSNDPVAWQQAEDENNVQLLIATLSSSHLIIGGATAIGQINAIAQIHLLKQNTLSVTDYNKRYKQMVTTYLSISADDEQETFLESPITKEHYLKGLNGDFIMFRLSREALASVTVLDLATAAESYYSNTYELARSMGYSTIADMYPKPNMRSNTSGRDERAYSAEQHSRGRGRGRGGRPQP